MAYVEPHAFDDKDVSLLCVAGSTREAHRIEATLVAEGIDYTLALTPYLEAGPFSSDERPGVGFYVISGQIPFCRMLLATHKLVIA